MELFTVHFFIFMSQVRTFWLHLIVAYPVFAFLSKAAVVVYSLHGRSLQQFSMSTELEPKLRDVPIGCFKAL